MSLRPEPPGSAQVQDTPQWNGNSRRNREPPLLTTATTARREFLAGARAEVPMLLGVLPFGLIYGALALQAGIPPMAALAMSSIVLAGSAQFVGTQLFAVGAPGALIILTTFVVNLRHMLYSASVAPYLSRLRSEERRVGKECRSRWAAE